MRVGRPAEDPGAARQSSGYFAGMSNENGSRLLQWLHRDGGGHWGTDPGAYDPEYMRAALAQMDKVFGPRRYFGVEASGWENVPPSPVMLVSNHSGGTSIPDAWGLGWAWYKHFGTERVLHGLAHEMIFSLAPVGRMFTRLGAVRASPARAIEVMSQLRHDVAVMPGGDLDTWRPWKDRYKVRFAGRTGFARVALQAGVPIVPVAHVGAHHTLMVLTDGSRFAKRVGLPEIARASIFPVHLSLPWGLGVGPLPHLPLPVTLRYRFGAPIYPPDDVVAGETPSPEVVREHAARVERAVQAELDVLAAEGGSGLRQRLRRLGDEIFPSTERAGWAQLGSGSVPSAK